MRKLLHLAAALVALTLPALSQAGIIYSGDLTGGGFFSGAVDRASAWIEENPVDGRNVNFWTLSGNAGDVYSFTVSSNVLEFGMSLYEGLLDELDLIVPGFDNSGSFANLTFVAGTPELGAIGTQLLNIVLPTTGQYLLAIGGEGFGFGDLFAYNLEVTASTVPAPAALWLLATGLAGLVVVRRRRTS